MQEAVATGDPELLQVSGRLFGMETFIFRDGILVFTAGVGEKGSTTLHQSGRRNSGTSSKAEECSRFLRGNEMGIHVLGPFPVSNVSQ